MNARIAGAVVLGLALGGCRDLAGPALLAPAGMVPRANNVSGTYGVVDATVFAPGGAPAAGFVVTVVNRDMGPFTRDGDPTSYSGALTDAGGHTTIAGLPVPGEYCVLARPLTSLPTATGFGTVYAPLPITGQTTPTPPTSGLGVIATGPNGPSVPLSPQSFQTYCFATSAQPAPLVLGADRATAAVRLDLQPGGTLDVRYLDAAGKPQPDPAWVVQPLAPPPWMGDFSIPPGVKSGVLLSAAPPVNGVDQLTGIPAAPIVLESGILSVPGQGLLTSTEHLVGTGGSQTLTPIVLQPLLCTLNRHGEPAGDGGTGIDFLGPVKDGFRADFGPPLTLRNEISIFYDERHAGTATLRFRVLVGGQALDLLARYTAEGTGGQLLSETGAAYVAGVRATPFFAPGTIGVRRVTWVITGLPAGLTGAAYRLDAALDGFPDAAGTLQPIRQPESCAGGQGNDDQWWVM